MKNFRLLLLLTLLIAPSGEGDIVLTLEWSALPDSEGSASVVLDVKN